MAAAAAPPQTQHQTPSDNHVPLPRAKQAAFTRQLLELCSARTSAPERSAADLLFIRDRLHERFAFFRLWPPKLQALLCRLAVAE